MNQSDIVHIYENAFRRNYRKLHLYASYLLHNSEEGRDLVSEVFVKLLESKENIAESDDQLDGFLFISVRNRCLDALKHRSVELEYFEAQRFANRITGDNYDEYDERLGIIRETINLMTPQARMVFEQCYLNNKKYSEVAEAMGISIDGVKKHIVRGLAKLRARFNVNYKNRLSPKDI